MSKGNKGRFRPGPDRRRHVFTTAERRRGFKAARRKLYETIDPVDGPAWLMWKVKRAAGQTWDET